MSTFQTALVYQLQRRVRTLREQVQRKDLHLDLLRRKLALQEDNTKVKTILQSERDEANLRVKKLVKQVDRLQLQLADSKAQVRDLNAQLAEAADYKVCADHVTLLSLFVCFLLHYVMCVKWLVLRLHVLLRQRHISFIIN